MKLTMHAKSDSEVTSLDASSPPRSPRRPLYYVQSPSQHDVEKMSYGSSPLGSPHHYHCSPIHHSRESSTSRFSASLKPGHHSKHSVPWKKMHRVADADGDDDDDDDDELDGGGLGGSVRNLRLYLCSVFGFVVMFTIFSLILWGASKSYEPKISVKHIVFHSFNIQAGMDNTGVPTDMLSMNSTVKMFYRNPATFFGVHVSSTPFELYYYQLKVASGQCPVKGCKSCSNPACLLVDNEAHQKICAILDRDVLLALHFKLIALHATMKKFYESRKSERHVVTTVLGHQVPLYGGVSVLGGARDHQENIAVPLNLTFVLRSRGHILGKLVKTKFYKGIRCSVTLRGKEIGKPHNLTHSCIYQ